MDTAAQQLIVPVANKLINYGEYTVKFLERFSQQKISKRKALLAYANTSRDILDLISVQDSMKVTPHSFLYSGLNELEVDAIMATNKDKLFELFAASLVTPGTRAKLYKNFIGNRKVQTWCEGPFPLNNFEQLEIGCVEGSMSGATVYHRKTKAEQAIIDFVKLVVNSDVTLKNIEVGKLLGAASYTEWGSLLNVAPWEKSLNVLRVNNGKLTADSQLKSLLYCTLENLLKRCNDDSLCFGLDNEQLSGIINNNTGTSFCDDTIKKLCKLEECNRLGRETESLQKSTLLRIGGLVCSMLLMGMQIRALEACHIDRGYQYSHGSSIAEPIADIKKIPELQEIFFLPLECQDSLVSILCNAKLASEWVIFKTEVLHGMDIKLHNWANSTVPMHKFSTLQELRDMSGIRGKSPNEMKSVETLMNDVSLYGNKYDNNVTCIGNSNIPSPGEALDYLRSAVISKYRSTTNNKHVREKCFEKNSLQGITLDLLLGINADTDKNVFEPIRKGWSELYWLGTQNSTNTDLLYTSAKERSVGYVPSSTQGINTRYTAQNVLQPLYLHLDAYAVRRASTRMHAVIGCPVIDKARKGPMYAHIKDLAKRGELYSISGWEEIICKAKELYKIVKVSDVKYIASNICTKGGMGKMENSYIASITREILHDLVVSGSPDTRDPDSEFDGYFKAVYNSNVYSDRAPLSTLVCNQKIDLAGTQAGLIENSRMGLYIGKHVVVELEDWKKIGDTYTYADKTNVTLRVNSEESKMLVFEMGDATSGGGHLERVNRSIRIHGSWKCNGGFNVD